MNIVTRIGRGKVEHAAEYNPETGRVSFYCNSLKYPDHYAVINDYTAPDAGNVTCKKCLANISEWGL